jgi:hypothetical protein
MENKLLTAEPRCVENYREVKIGRTLYCVTSIFNGEKELGPALEKLAVQSVLAQLDDRAKELLRC